MGLTRSRYDVGIVGAGHIASVLHMPIIESMPETEIAYVADLDGEKASRALLGYDGTAVEVDDPASDLPPCNLALVATPVGVRTPYLAEFGRRGTPILTEKPFAPDLETHREFLELGDDIACNYQYVNFSSTRQARRIVESGAFGELERVELSQGMVPVSGLGKDHYRQDVDLSGGGVLVESGCHTFSQLVYMFNDLSVVDADLTWKGDLDVAATIKLRASTPHGEVPVELSLSMLEPLPTECRLVFETVEIRGDHTDAASTMEVADGQSGGSVALDHSSSWATSGKQAVYLNWRQFLEDIEQGIDVRRTTMMEVTELLTNTYDRAGDRRRLETA